MKTKPKSESKSNESIGYFSNPKYKNQIMEKYLRGLNNNNNTSKSSICDTKCNGGMELSKWLESAAKFTPDKSNYIEWDSKKYGF